ncbi:cell wall-binding repeat-containing protein [Agromyces silvae]|uniref:cell wall-binding repeat-containing protein n=1 Tax=Agromyces silvae TaxID=3388266 RepID=UPI00280A6AAF|nr:cell wall-binding repeat-containing protein [Agromyces protaetiae]
MSLRPPRLSPLLAANRAPLVALVTVALMMFGVTPSFAGSEPSHAERPSQIGLSGAVIHSEPVVGPVEGLASIAGVVRGLNGTPLQGVRVSLQNHGTGAAQVRDVFTDEHGAYRREGLLPGTYGLGFRWHGSEYLSGWQPVGWEGGPIALGLGETRSNVDARMTAAGSIAGVVTGSDGQPARWVSAVVRRFEPSGESWQVGSAYTDALGVYRVGDLEPGTYVVGFEPREPVDAGLWWGGAQKRANAQRFEVAEGENVTAIDAELPHGGSLSGVVTSDAGVPLAGVRIIASGAEGIVQSRITDREVTTDAMGRYRIGGLMTGEYTLTYRPPYEACHLQQWWPDARDESTAQRIPVSVGAEVAGRDAQLSPGATVSGVVSNDAQAKVQLYEADGYRYPYGPAKHPEPDGSYEICVTHSGKYTVNFAPSDSAYRAEWWDDKETRDAADTLEIEMGEAISGIDATFTTGATIAGRVTAGAGGPAMADVDVRLHREVDGRLSVAGRFTTDASGEYAFTKVESGTYSVQFEAPDASAYVDQWLGGSADEVSAKRITVARDALIGGLDAPLEVGASLVGTVVDSAGRPVAGAQISSSVADGDASARKLVTTNSVGAYELHGLPAGEYTLWINATGYFSDVRTPLELATGAHLSVGAVVLTRMATLSGTLKADGGFDVDGQVLVELYRFEAGEYRFVVSESTRLRPFYEPGTYTIGQLRPGKYKLAFGHGWSGYATEWWSDQPDLASATVFELAEGETRSGFDAELAGGRVRLSDVRVEGVPAVGHELTATGSSSTAGATLTYQWSMNGTPIAGATERTLRLTPAHLGARVSVTVSAGATGHISVSASAGPAAMVGAGTIPLEEPTISGEAKVGRTLTAHIASTLETAHFGFQWFVGDAPVAGATDSTFVPGADHVGQHVSVRITASAPAFTTVERSSAPTAPILPSSVKVERIAGVDRYGTSAQLSKSVFSPGVPVAYVASGAKFPDALAAGPVAYRNGGPVLLTAPDQLPTAVAEELARLRPGKIVVLGSEETVSGSVEAELRRFTPGTVQRIAGVDRFATAVELSKSSTHFGTPVVYLANGLNFPDALAAGPTANVRNGVILLTIPDRLPDVVAAELTRLRPETIVVLGGETNVSTAIEAELRSITSASVVRVAGVDRFETAVQLSESTFSPGADIAYVASGMNFPDALSANAAAGGRPVLLTIPDRLPDVVVEELTRLRPAKIVVLGGDTTVSTQVAAELARIGAEDG